RHAPGGRPARRSGRRDRSPLCRGRRRLGRPPPGPATGVGGMTAQVRLATRGAFVLGALGGVAVLVAWAGSSSTPLVGRQAAWGAVGVSGTFGVAAASVLWVVTLRGAVARRATEVRAAILLGPEDARARAGAATVARPLPGAP